MNSKWIFQYLDFNKAEYTLVHWTFIPTSLKNGLIAHGLQTGIVNNFLINYSSWRMLSMLYCGYNEETINE